MRTNRLLVKCCKKLIIEVIIKNHKILCKSLNIIVICHKKDRASNIDVN